MNGVYTDEAFELRQAGDESWLPVVGFEDAYEVSDMGRVRSLDRIVDGGPRAGARIQRGRVLNPGWHTSGYPQVSLSVGGRRATAYVHRLVLTAFRGPAPEGMEGCHNNGDPTDCRLTNLRWDTRSENHLDAVRHGTYRNQGSSMTNCKRWHPLSGENIRMVKGARVCRTCARAASARWHAKQKAEAEGGES